jgi:hypothetical protein
MRDKVAANDKGGQKLHSAPSPAAATAPDRVVPAVETRAQATRHGEPVSGRSGGRHGQQGELRHCEPLMRAIRCPESKRDQFEEVPGLNASSHHDAMMLRCGVRTTIDLPDDLHKQAQAIARDTHRTLSETVVDLMRRGLGAGRPADLSTDPRTGLPLVTVGTIVTSEDVRSLEDEE